MAMRKRSERKNPGGSRHRQQRRRRRQRPAAAGHLLPDEARDQAAEAADQQRRVQQRPGCSLDDHRGEELLEQQEFGLTETRTYEVDYTFISNYAADTPRT
jgi:hypothetical protein